MPSAIDNLSSAQANVQSVTVKQKPKFRKPLSDPQNQAAMGVVTGKLSDGKTNAWDTYNQRRTNECVDCHQKELTSEGREGLRESPLGEFSSMGAVLGVRSKAKYGSREEVLKNYADTRQALLDNGKHSDVRDLDDAAADLKRDIAKPGQKPVADARANQ